MINDQAKELINVIKAIVISEPGGIPFQALQETYKDLVGDDIPYRKCGFASMYHLIQSIPEITRGRNEKNEQILVGTSAKTKHLEEMIKYQKPRVDRTYRNNKRRRQHADFSTSIKRQRMENLSDCSNLQSSFDNSMYYKDKKSPNTSLHEKNEVGPISISDSKPNRVYEPILDDRQLIGDDYFLQLTIRYLDYPLERKNNKSAIRCGTVASGQTLADFVKTLKYLKNMSNKVLICLGTEDIYQRRTADEMITDLKKILNLLKNKFGYNEKQITICTLPPVANVPIGDKRLKTFYVFNNYIKYDLKGQCRIIDLYNEYITESNLSTNYDLFQMQARMVSGTPHPYVLWNLKGRVLAMRVLSE